MVTKLSRFRKRKASSVSKNVFGWGLVLSIFALGTFLIWHNLRIYQKRVELQERAQSLRQEISELTVKQERLDVEIEAQGSETRQEEILREQGLYKRPGEEVVTVLPAEEQEAEKQEKKRAWWDPFGWFQE